MDFSINVYSLNKGEAVSLLSRDTMASYWLTMRPCPKCRQLMNTDGHNFKCARCGFTEINRKKGPGKKRGRKRIHPVR